MNDQKNRGKNMKVVLLAGGFGTRLSEETVIKPKPMIEIGGKPILWHIMKNYAHFGHKEFYVALGYKAEVIKEYFLNYSSLNSDFSVDISTGFRSPLTYPKIFFSESSQVLLASGLKASIAGLITGRNLKISSPLKFF